MVIEDMAPEHLAHIRALLADLPPPTAEQLARLRAVFAADAARLRREQRPAR